MYPYKKTDRPQIRISPGRHLAVIRLESSALLVDVLPEVGGKVGQIFEKTSGCNLLIPPQRPHRTIPIDGNWLKHDISGMDDCFPNVARGAYPSSPWTSVELPDLGEWTHGAWNIKRKEARQIVMEMAGHALPYFATKTISFADEHTLRFSYQVENRSRFPLRYLWSAHPLLAVGEKFNLRLPGRHLRFRRFPPDDNVYSWHLYNATDISSEWIPRGATLKIFVTGLSEGWCALELPEYTLRFTFDPHALPAVGIWYNNFGFPQDGGNPFRCIALEPCTSPSDLLDHLAPGAYPEIVRGGATEWSMQLKISVNANEP
jgi:hypothetical protein